MSKYLKEIEEFVTSLRGGSPFLSPKEREFVKKLESSGIPLDISKRALSKCLREFPPERRAKISILLCEGSIEEELRKRKRDNFKETMWVDIFYRKLEAVGIKVDSAPSSVEEAENMLREIEKKVALELWNQLSKKEKKEIFKKYNRYRKDKDIFNSLIVSEIFKRFKLPRLSLYVS